MTGSRSGKETIWTIGEYLAIYPALFKKFGEGMGLV